MRGSKTRETSAINGGEWARFFAFWSHSPPPGKWTRYPLDRPLGGLESTYVRSGLYGETQEDMKMPVKREAHPCGSFVQIVCFRQHGNEQDVFILQYEVVMRCTGTSSTYLGQKTEQVVSYVSHADSSGGARFVSLGKLTSVNRVFVVLLSNPRQIPL